MRRFVLAIAAVVMLTACSTLQGGYDSRSRNDCERDNRDVERAMC
jgi:hypothetical protein